MEKIKAVIFDLDGTIANTLPLCIQSFRLALEPLTGLSFTDAEIISTFGPSEEGTIMALAPAHYEKGIADYLRYYEYLHQSLCPAPFVGLVPILQNLKNKGVHIAMVTGKGKYSTEISLRHLHLANYFEQIETGSIMGARKAAGIQIILDSLSHLTNKEVIYVGDAPSDVTASRQAGITAVAAAWADTSEPEKLQAIHPDKLFYTISDFEDWLLNRI